MPQYCVAANCRNRCKTKCVDALGKPITFHRFPNDPSRRQQWIEAICRSAVGEKPWKPTACSCVCSVHFTEDCFDSTGKGVRIRKDAIPTLFHVSHNAESFIPSQLKAEYVSIEDTVEPSTSIFSKSNIKQDPSIRTVEYTFKMLQEHNYYCSSTPKDLKLALDKSMHMEQKLWNKLGNSVKLQKRLKERVHRLLQQLDQARLGAEMADLQQLHLETGKGNIHMDQVAEPLEMGNGTTFTKDDEVFLPYAEKAKPNKTWNKLRRKSQITVPKKIIKSIKCEKDVCKSKHSGEQPITHTEESSDTCSECGNKVKSKVALISNERSHATKRPYTRHEISNTLRQSATIPKRQWIPTGEKLYVCGECGKGFSMLASLIVHQRVHTKQKQYPCTKCGQSFSQSSNLTRHETVSLIPHGDSEKSLTNYFGSHGDNSTNPFQGLTVTSRDVPLRINQERMTYAMDPNDFEGKESVGNRTGNAVVAAVYLLSLNQDGELESIVEMQPELERDTACHNPNGTPRIMLSRPVSVETQSKVLQIPVKSMRDSSQMWEEFNFDAGGELSQWQSGFRNVEVTNIIHGFAEEEKINTCDYASKMLNVKTCVSQLSKLKNKRRYACSKCNKSFCKKSVLTVHKRTHLKTKPFQCTECEKSFWEKSVLNGHLRTHYGETLYECTVCEKKFSKKAIFDGHLRIHMVEQPNTCAEFQKHLKYSTALPHYRKRHAAERLYPCTECEKVFIHKSRLIRHHETHSGAIFLCGKCNKSFRQSKHLTTHERQYHGMRKGKLLNPH